VRVEDVGSLLRGARNRHGVSRESLAARVGLAPAAISEIEEGRVSPEVATLEEMFELLGEDLIFRSEARHTGIDLTLNQGNLELSPGQRLRKGLAFADLVRRMRPGGSEDLGRSLEPCPIFQTFSRFEVDFVVIGSIAGLIYGSAYPTYDLDLACASDKRNLERLVPALEHLGVAVVGLPFRDKHLLPCDTKFGSIDLLTSVPGVESYGTLSSEATWVGLEGARVRVASLDHLIAMKRVAGQRKDQLMVMEYVELADEIRRREAEEDQA
jgi:transcriptional regulator with XRE-family HTH domain